VSGTHTRWRGVKRGGRIKTKRPTADVRRAEESARITVWARASQPHGIALCEVCGEAPPTEYQHRKAKIHCSKDERWAVSNGLAVCGHGNYSGCHGERIHQQPTEAYANGWSVLSGQDPRKKRVRRRGVWVRFNDEGGMTPAPDEDEDESRVA
jgi:hypothetical protein